MEFALQTVNGNIVIRLMNMKHEQKAKLESHVAWTSQYGVLNVGCGRRVKIEVIFRVIFTGLRHPISIV